MLSASTSSTVRWPPGTARAQALGLGSAAEYRLGAFDAYWAGNAGRSRGSVVLAHLATQDGCGSEPEVSRITSPSAFGSRRDSPCAES